MKLFLKIIFKEMYGFLKTKESRTFLKLAFRYGHKNRYQEAKIRFLKYTFIVPDFFSFLWQFKEIFVDKSYLFNSENKKPIIIDCGANVGTSILYFKSLYPQSQIFAFEADPNIVKILQRNIQQNNLENIQIEQKAVWVDDKGIALGLEGADGASIFYGENKTKVASIRLKEFLESFDKVDMLKMDIEGAENKVILDCVDVLHKVNFIFIEYHALIGQTQDLDKILWVLQQNNFRYYIQEAQSRKSPLQNHQYKNNEIMDLQLNVFAYKT